MSYKIADKIKESLILMLTGGIIYFYLEIIFDGESHFSMIICGGICFYVVGEINERIGKMLSFPLMIILGATIITTIEFICGLIVNKWLGLQVWSYSTMPFNFMGQICLPYFFLWMIMSVVIIVLNRLIRAKIFE